MYFSTFLKLEVVRALKCCLEKKDATIAVLTYSRAQKVRIERDPKHMFGGSVTVLTLDECVRQGTCSHTVYILT